MPPALAWLKGGVLRVKLTTMSPDWPWARQTPGGQGAWKDCQFQIDDASDSADWWVVYDDLPGEQTIQCRPGGALLITPEPPSLKQYNEEFAAQFDWVITPDRRLAHPRKIHGQQGLPWHVGRRQAGGKNLAFARGYDELKSLVPPGKDRLISVIASDKAGTPGHRARRDFVQRLQAHFGSRVDVFGWGGREIPDKWDGIAPYRYHLAIENSSTPDYWTEKLSDAFLAGAYPIYFGCPNIFDYFPPDSLSTIDIADEGRGLAQVESILGNDPYDSARISRARELVLERYNLFAMLADFCSQRELPRSAVPRTLRPSSAFMKPPSLLQRVISKWKRLSRASPSNG